VRELFADEGSQHYFSTFCNKYGVTRYPFTQFYGILAAIPSKWKANIMQICEDYDNPLKIFSLRNTSQLIYISLINKITYPPSAMVKWNLSVDVMDKWEIIFKIPFTTLSDSRLFTFNFLSFIAFWGRTIS